MTIDPKHNRVLDRRVFAENERLFHVGDQGALAYIVQSGLVEVRADQGPTELGLYKVGPQGIVGELALVGRSLRPHTAVALEPTVCILVHESEFRRRLEATDPFVRGILRVLVENLARPWVLPGRAVGA